MSRRSFVAGGLLAAGAIPALGRQPANRMASGQPAHANGSRGKARNLILFIADGMSLGTLTLGDYARRAQGRGQSPWLELMNADGARTALCSTHSASGLVTDSAAGASAWSIGRKVTNGSINVTPRGDTPTPLFVRAKAAGRAVGLVSNTDLNDATPACLVATAKSRSMRAEIAQQVLDRADLLLGGGARHFTDLLDPNDPRPIVRTARDMIDAPEHDGPGILGLFAPGVMPYALDRPETSPSLPAMTLAALHRLASAPDGFVLLVEGARVDHAAHANDAGALVAEMLEFDDALMHAADFARMTRDTLLVVTTDHANANPGLSLYPPTCDEGLTTLLKAKHSFEWIEQHAEAAGSTDIDSITDLIEQATTIRLDADQQATLARAIAGDRVDPFSAASGWTSVLGSLLANHTGCAFLSPNHASDLVVATAIGPGSEAMRPVMDNTDLHSVMARALGVPMAGLAAPAHQP